MKHINIDDYSIKSPMTDAQYAALGRSKRHLEAFKILLIGLVVLSLFIFIGYFVVYLNVSIKEALIETRIMIFALLCALFFTYFFITNATKLDRYNFYLKEPTNKQFDLLNNPHTLSIPSISSYLEVFKDGTVKRPLLCLDYRIVLNEIQNNSLHPKLR